MGRCCSFFFERYWKMYSIQQEWFHCNKRKSNMGNNETDGIYTFDILEKKWTLFMEYPESKDDYVTMDNLSPYYDKLSNLLYIFYTAGTWRQRKGRFLCINMQNQEYSILDYSRSALVSLLPGLNTSFLFKSPQVVSKMNKPIDIICEQAWTIHFNAATTARFSCSRTPNHALFDCTFSRSMRV